MWYSESIWKLYDPHVFLGFLDPLHGPPDVAPLFFAPAWPWYMGGFQAGRRCGLWRTPVTWTYPQTSDMFEDDFPTLSIFQGGICWFPRWVPWFVFFLGVIYISVLFLVVVFGDRSCWDVETFGTRFLELVSFSFQPFQGDQLQADLSAMAGGYLWILCTSAGFVLFAVLQGYVLSSKGS